MDGHETQPPQETWVDENDNMRNAPPPFRVKQALERTTGYSCMENEHAIQKSPGKPSATIKQTLFVSANFYHLPGSNFECEGVDVCVRADTIKPSMIGDVEVVPWGPDSRQETSLLYRRTRWNLKSWL